MKVAIRAKPESALLGDLQGTTPRDAAAAHRRRSVPAAATALDVSAWRARMLAGLFVAFVAVSVWMLVQRGPWLDEFWSLWQSQHDLPLADILRQRWMADFNPPLFSIVHWIATPWLGESMPAHRALNFVALGWAAAFTRVALRRYPGREPFLVVFAALALSMPSTLVYMAEARSYFAQMCAHYVLVAATVLIADSAGTHAADIDWRVDKTLVAMVVATLAVAVNLHYISTLLAGLLMSAAVLACLRQRQRRWAATLAAATLVSLVPAVGYLLAQLPFLLAASTHYWVRGSLGYAVLWFLYMGFEAVRTNPLASLLALATLLALLPARALRDAPWRRALAAVATPRRSVGLLLAVLLGFSAAMLAAHLRQPIVTARYLLNFQVVCLGLIACLAAEALNRRRLLSGLLFVVALLSVGIHGQKIAGEERWDESALKVQEFRRACPASPVYAVIVPRPTFSTNDVAVLRWAYQQQARPHGIAFRYYEVGVEPPPSLAGTCPTLWWVEHVDFDTIGRDAGTQEVLRFLGLNPAGVDLRRARTFTSDTGFVLSLAAASPAPPP